MPAEQRTSSTCMQCVARNRARGIKAQHRIQHAWHRLGSAYQNPSTSHGRAAGTADATSVTEATAVS